jgi:hypothetical protein
LNRLEAICDAVAMVHSYWEPESEAYALRNPGLLPGEVGKRKFTCHKAGYTALLYRVEMYCKEHPGERVEVLLKTFGIDMRRQQESALDFMARCANSTLRLETPLGWFLDGNS